MSNRAGVVVAALGAFLGAAGACGPSPREASVPASSSGSGEVRAAAAEASADGPDAAVVGASPGPSGSAISSSSASAQAAERPPRDADADDERLSFEGAYLPGAFPWPEDRDARKAKLIELERWNAGGVSEGERWHAAPRVVIGEPVLTAGKLGTRDVMRVLRHDQYWTVRRCYEARLRDQPKLEGRTVLRLTVGGDGTIRSARPESRGHVPDDRRHGQPMRDREVVDCLARGFTHIRVPAPRSKTATVLVSIDVWPGDAPLPVAAGAPRRGTVALPRLDDAVTSLRPQLVACFRGGKRGAWGRMALQLELGSDGHADDVDEVETTFPDAEITACAAGVLRTIAAPRPLSEGGEARAIVVLRWSAAR